MRRQTATGPDGLTRNYTSAKLETQGLFSARYGTFVARMQLPAVSGLWPAFWMVGDDFATVAWPASGEIDAMEAVGQNPFAVSGTVHGPSLSSSTAYALGHTFTSTTPLTGGFHVYGITWSPTSISWTVDGRVYGTTTTASLQAGWGVAVHPAVPSDPQPRPGRDLDRSPELGHAVPVQSARRLGARVSVGRRTWCAWFPLRNALAQADYMGK